MLASRGLIAVYFSQALSAFADNALLIIAIALLKNVNLSDQAPWLQAGFVLPFILLAPFLGVLADSLPKGRVMLLGNTIKLLGTTLVLFTPFTLMGYGLVGVGAAVYSPAKYGILGQLVTSDKLVKANGWMEGSTLVAILLGVVVGGILADWSLQNALWLVLSLYALAMIINLAIPPLSIERAYRGESVWCLTVSFISQARQLWRIPNARLSLTGTSLFWAMGSSLRLMLFAWVPIALLVEDNQLPATLMGVVSIGIILGAGLVSWRLQLHNAKLALWGGLALAPLLFALAFTNHLMIAIVLLVALGIAGGWFVVPLNALLQQQGHQSIGTGRALAVQNLFENAGMFLAVSLYGLLSSYLSITLIIILFATLFGANLLILSKKSMIRT